MHSFNQWFDFLMVYAHTFALPLYTCLAMSTEVRYDNSYTAFENKLHAKGKMDQAGLVNQWALMPAEQQARCVELVCARKREIKELWCEMTRHGHPGTHTILDSISDATLFMLLAGLFTLFSLLKSGSQEHFFNV